MNAVGLRPLAARCALLIAASFGSGACSALELVHSPGRAAQPVAGAAVLARVRAACLSFNVLTLEIPRPCDAEQVVERMLSPVAKRVSPLPPRELQVRATPDRGLWWLTRLLGIRRAAAEATLLVPRRSTAVTRTASAERVRQ